MCWHSIKNCVTTKKRLLFLLIFFVVVVSGTNQANFGAGLDQSSFGAGSNFDNYGNPMQSDFGSPSQKIESLSINTPPKPHKPKKDGPMPEGFSKSEDGKIVCMHPGCGKTFTR